MKYMPGIAVLVLVLLALPGLAACNTMEGLGKDIGKAGETLEDSAK